MVGVRLLESQRLRQREREEAHERRWGPRQRMTDRMTQRSPRVPEVVHEPRHRAEHGARNYRPQALQVRAYPPQQPPRHRDRDVKDLRRLPPSEPKEQPKQNGVS